MRSTITLLLLFCSTLFFAQKNSTENELIFENLKLEMTIDSYYDVNEINLSDIKSIFKQSKINQPIEFNVHCNNIPILNLKSGSNLSIKIDGNSNDLETFFKQIHIIKKNIKKYYINQKTNK